MASDVKYTIAVDLGESSVRVAAGYRDEADELQVAAVAVRQSQGIKAGRIENIALVDEALSKAIVRIENKLNVKIQQAYTGISGEYIRSAHYSESVIVDEPSSGVSRNDLASLQRLMSGVQAPAEESILEYAPESYTIDNKSEVKNPIGTFGKILGSTYNFVLCEREAHNRLERAFTQAGITVKRCYPNVIMAAEATLTQDEKDAGVALVDIGTGVTNIAIYYQNTLRQVASIPMGASAINNDMSSLLIQERSIEQVKCNHARALAERAPLEYIELSSKSPRDAKQVLLRNLAIVAQERLTDIIIFVQREIRDAGYEGRLPYGIVLTGGGSKMRDIDELFKRHLGLDVRVAHPEEGLGAKAQKLVGGEESSSLVGMLLRGTDMDRSGVGLSCTIPMGEEEILSSEQEQESEVAKPVKVKRVRKSSETKHRGADTQGVLWNNLDEDDDDEPDDVEESKSDKGRKQQPIKREDGGFFGSAFKRASTWINELLASTPEDNDDDKSNDHKFND